MIELFDIWAFYDLVDSFWGWNWVFFKIRAPIFKRFWWRFYDKGSLFWKSRWGFFEDLSTSFYFSIAPINFFALSNFSVINPFKFFLRALFLVLIKTKIKHFLSKPQNNTHTPTPSQKGYRVFRRGCVCFILQKSGILIFIKRGQLYLDWW